jgi:hypothetical protein
MCSLFKFGHQGVVVVRDHEAALARHTALGLLLPPLRDVSIVYSALNSSLV